MDISSRRDGPPPFRWHNSMGWLAAAFLAAAVVLAYRPAWNGEPIWDDDAHMTRPDLQGWDGLGRIWLEPGLFGRPAATQQYYPLLHSAFWVQHKLWGDAPRGYHLVNIALHVTAALLVWQILRKLAIPGAWLAAAIFALHPVHVESVAWITELKNTLSAAFYLGAMLAYLQFDTSRRRLWYAIALVLFLLGLLCKTIIATLPAGLLVIFWWQRGKLSFRQDVLPLLPWFVLGAAAGIFTAVVERYQLQAHGAEYQMTLLERFLLAGRVPWFYAAKLVWPVNLTFIYPRWHISQSDWRQYLFLLATLGFLVVCWMVRRKWRGPLAAVLFFGGTLFPVLGFFNVYPFRYSYVADHFQYLASLGLIALAVGSAAALLTRAPRWLQYTGLVAGLGIVAVLGWRTHEQSKMYADAEQLYQTTIARNPNCWMAYNNLGEMRNRDEKYDEAKRFFETAHQINPNTAEVQNNIGVTLEREDRPDEALREYQRAVEINPDYALAHTNLGNLYLKRREYQLATDHFRKVLDRHASAAAHGNLAVALLGADRKDEALLSFRQAVALDPKNTAARLNLAPALSQRGELDEAEAIYRDVLAISPSNAAAEYNLGNLLAAKGRLNDAANHLRRAIDIQPDYAEAYNNLGAVLAQQGKFNEAIAHYQQALKIRRDYPEARQNLEAALGRQRSHVP